jgi:hypothetical protein
VSTRIAVCLLLIAAGLVWQTAVFWRAHGLTYFRPGPVLAMIVGQLGLAWAAWELGLLASALECALPPALGILILVLKLRDHVARWRAR